MEVYRGRAYQIIDEVEKAVIGKKDILEKILMAILAGGHILIEDIPGTGKTTMALSFSRAMGLEMKRVQFTPDVLPSDLTGFTLYKKETGEFVYHPGAAICNLLMADEINRTSPKTQSALLEVMEEHQVTVDGITHHTGDPFIVIATQNPAGSAGTQLLPEAQMDRFMICVKMGYPSLDEEIELIKRGQKSGKGYNEVLPVISGDNLIAMKKEVEKIYIHERILRYIAELSKASRENGWTELGVSPRGTVALTLMAKACSWLKGREYVIPEDVREVFPCVAGHRIYLNMKAKVGRMSAEEVVRQILEAVKPPSLREKRKK